VSGLIEQKRVESEIYELFSGAPKGPTYLAEAEFGLSQIQPFLERLTPGARVLEVGSGPCIALAEIARSWPYLDVHGIEPMSSGFAHFQSFLEAMQVKLPNMCLFRGGYEDFPPSDPWDLIFLINVFEHLPDWREFLSFIRERLAVDGTCVILCPNYGFPYESHFGIPVIGNKPITGRIFARRIAEFERTSDLAGLYDSLNFVKLADVRAACRDRNLALEVDCSVIRTLVNRLDSEPEFADRQKLVAPAARMLRRIGLLEWLLQRRSIQDRLPYMKLVLRREG
jgi:SAM-dependent methyltransferase